MSGLAKYARKKGEGHKLDPHQDYQQSQRCSERAEGAERAAPLLKRKTNCTMHDEDTNGERQ
jgi:stringent starvation protein B